MGALSKVTSPLARMGFGQKIATVALAVLALIALIALLAGGERTESDAAPSGFTPASYSSDSADGRSSGNSSEGDASSATPLSATPTPSPSDGLDAIAVDDLPSQAQHTIALIDAGGPYPYSRDGVVFANRERLLPQHPRGWYHEYTVKTPGESDRGVRRVIAAQDGTLYYTADHYASFRRVTR